MRRGAALGRFLPPHAGHELLVRTACQLVDELTVLVRAAADDLVPAERRAAWLRDMVPGVEVHLLPDPGAGARALADAVRAVLPHPPDALFAGDGRDAGLARALGVRYLQLDPGHRVVPSIASEIRADPFGRWADLPPAVRPHYARTICLHGPESTGKSTLAPQLARHYETLWLPEYGRTYCEINGTALTMADLLAIGRTHSAMARAALRQCNRRLILDTDALMTAAWAEMLFDRSDLWFQGFAEVADLYLLLDIDLPWVDDGTRFFGDPARRRRFFDLSRDQLDRRGLRYAVISGPPEERLPRALAAIRAAGLG